MGTPQFAVRPLHALAEAGHELAAVVTRVDKPAGRGRSMAAPPVKLAAQQMGLTVFQPKRVRESEFVETLRNLVPDVIVVAAYGQILPKEILFMPKYGCVNIHASLLPAYRGAAPINWAVIHGDSETGITIMRMDEGMDTGDILMQERVSIDAKDTAGTLTEKLSVLGAKLITTVLPLIATGNLPAVAQDSSQATLAPLLKKGDGRIDWKLPAVEIHNRVRGLSPWPGAFTFLNGKLMKIIESEVVAGDGEPGMLTEVNRRQLTAGTGKGMLRILSIQPEGKKVMTAEEFLRGRRDGLSGQEFSSDQRTQ